MEGDLPISATAPRPAHAWPIRFLPSLTDFAFLTPLVFLFAVLRGAKTLLGDGDTGWHIRTGEWILNHGAVPHTDLFSFSKPGQPWFAWEWGWDALFALIHARWGLTGVVYVNMLILGLASVLLYRLARSYTSNDVAAFAVTSLAMVVSSIHWLARPHLVGWIFLLLTCHIVRRARTKNVRLLWLMPILVAVWTNIHGSFFIGIAVLCAYAIGDSAGALLWCTGEDRRVGLKRGGMFAAVAVACAAATLINPYGIALHQHVLRYLSDTKQLENISEFQSVSFHSPLAVCLELLLFLAAGSMFWCWRNRQLGDAMILAGWAHLALVSSRNIPLFVFFAAPLVTGMLDGRIEDALDSPVLAIRSMAAWFRRTGVEFGRNDRPWRTHLVSILPMAILALLFAAPGRPGSLVAEYDRHDYPAAALETLASVPLSRIFTDDEWGDYLIYHLYPRNRVFIDGRSDFYGADLDRLQLDVISAKHGWQEQLKRYAIDTVLMRADAPLAGVLKETRDWALVYDDGVATVFRAVRTRPVSDDAGHFTQGTFSSVLPDRDRRLGRWPSGKPELQTLQIKTIKGRSS